MSTDTDADKIDCTEEAHERNDDLDIRFRARRKTYWKYILIFCGMLIVWVAMGLLSVPLVFGEFWFIAILAYLWRWRAVPIGRCHDLGYSGWLLIICLVTGLIPGLILLGCVDGQPYENKYGPDPKGRNYSRQSQGNNSRWPSMREKLMDSFHLSSGGTLSSKLRELKQLNDDGIITDEEFAAKKAEILKT